MFRWTDGWMDGWIVAGWDKRSTSGAYPIPIDFWYWIGSSQNLSSIRSNGLPSNELTWLKPVRASKLSKTLFANLP